VPSRRLQHELKREALLRAAIPAFNRRGFHQTSLDEIARKVGVTKAALYYYFPNKNALLAACLERAQSIAWQSLEQALRDGRNGREKITLMLRRYLENTIEDLGECMLLTEEHSLEARDRARLIEQRDETEKALRKLIAEGIEDGSIVPCNPKLAVFALLGAVNWVPKWFSRHGSWSHHQTAAAITEMLDRMLSTEPSPALVEDVGALRKGKSLGVSMTRRSGERGNDDDRDNAPASRDRLIEIART
jgi:TetR/AcrR family transcriptional regulator